MSGLNLPVAFFRLATMMYLLALPLHAIGDDSLEPGCSEDEYDMGDYCMSIVEIEQGSHVSGNKVTPFRKQGIVPGIKGNSPGRIRNHDALPKPATSGVIASDGYGVQLGAWSDKLVAQRIARSVQQMGYKALLSPVRRGNTVLWACITGPYADYDTAEPVLAALRQDRGFSNAWVKPLQGVTLQGIDE